MMAEFKHVLFATKKYHDKTCAEYKMLRAVESLRERYPGIYWRINPTIQETGIDWEMLKPIRYRGVFRCSVTYDVTGELDTDTSYEQIHSGFGLT
jgi:hypothetical protein